MVDFNHIARNSIQLYAHNPYAVEIAFNGEVEKIAGLREMVTRGAQRVGQLFGKSKPTASTAVAAVPKPGLARLPKGVDPFQGRDAPSIRAFSAMEAPQLPGPSTAPINVGSGRVTRRRGFLARALSKPSGFGAASPEERVARMGELRSEIQRIQGQRAAAQVPRAELRQQARVGRVTGQGPRNVREARAARATETTERIQNYREAGLADFQAAQRVRAVPASRQRAPEDLSPAERTRRSISRAAVWADEGAKSRDLARTEAIQRRETAALSRATAQAKREGQARGVDVARRVDARRAEREARRSAAARAKAEAEKKQREALLEEGARNERATQAKKTEDELAAAEAVRRRDQALLAEAKERREAGETAYSALGGGKPAAGAGSTTPIEIPEGFPKPENWADMKPDQQRGAINAWRKKNRP